MSDTKNTLQQDLFLVAKGQYHLHPLSKMDVAKLVCAFHILSKADDFPEHSVLHWLLEEFVYQGIVIQNVRKFGEVLLNNEGRFMYREMGYYERACQIIFDEISRTRVRDDKGHNLMPFTLPNVDPEIELIIRRYATHNLLASAG